MEVERAAILPNVPSDRERRESGFSDGSLTEEGSPNATLSATAKALEDLRRDSCDSGLSSSANTTLFHLSDDEGADRPKRPRRRRRKRLCESYSVARFEDVYRLTDEELGEGSYGKVRTCVHVYTGREYAVKIIAKSGWHFSRPKILKEIELYHLCRGRREIVQMIEYFEEDDAFYLVFEKAEGGHLLDQVRRRGRFTEKEAAAILRDLAAALSFLHGKGVAHRDLKPENVLCARGGQDNDDDDAATFLPVKLCDFDLCSAVYQTVTTPRLQSPVGSVEYMAPEVVEVFVGDDLDFFDRFDDDDAEDLELTYDKRCDLWSLGVIAYVLLCGYLPFTGTCGRDCGWADRGEECAACQGSLFRAIRSGRPTFPDDPWASISEEAKDLVRNLLVLDADGRIDAADVLRHPWIASGGSVGPGPENAPAVDGDGPKVLQAWHESVHVAKRSRLAKVTAMKKSATVLELGVDDDVDAVRPSIKVPSKTRKMRRQTSLVWFPEAAGPRWEC